MKTDKRSLSIAISITILLGVLIAYAGSDNGLSVNGVPVFAICCAFAFFLNWLAFIPANAAKTEHYFDLTGAITNIGMIVIAVLLSDTLDQRALIVSIMVLAWAIRLGCFLFIRVKQDGGDDRFDEIKPNAPRFFFVWTLQALWTIMTLACALVIVTSENKQEIGLIGQVGIVMWIVGFLFEVVADAQKRAFKHNPENKNHFINKGLWAYSKHPNYFGEILLWCGVAVMAIPILQGWQWVALISPIFVFLLITRLSGIPKLRQKAESKWGSQADYRKYADNTSLLIPWFPAK